MMRRVWTSMTSNTQSVQQDRLDPEQVHTPQRVFRVGQQAQPGRTVVLASVPTVLCQHPPDSVFVQFNTKALGQLFGVLGQPRCGFRRFNSRMASISSASGPLGPGLRLDPAEE